MTQREITEYVTKNQVTIVNSKNSGNMPLYLAHASYKVILSASEAYIKWKYKDLRKIDANISIAQYSNVFNEFFQDYQIACIPYGNNLIQEVFKNKDDRNLVLIIEESYNCVNADLLLGFVSQLIKEGASLRLIIINKITEYNDTLSTFFNVPIIDFSKKSYPVSSDYHPAGDLEQVIISVCKHGFRKNILVILPGNKQIKELKNKLDSYFEKRNKKPLILCLNSNSDCREIASLQKKIILSTDISQTLLAKLDIDSVIDTGLERGWKVIDEVPVSVLRNASKSTIQERKLLAGSSPLGVYHLCSDFSYEKRKEVSTVLEEYFDSMLLTLINMNIDIKSFHFFYAKSRYIINCFLKQLYLLGSIDQDRKITDIGKEILKLPLTVRFSRMLIEARKYHLEFDVLLCYLLSKFKNLRFHMTNDYTDVLKSDLLVQMFKLKKLYFENLNSNGDHFEEQKLLINKFVFMINITPSTYSNVSDIKKCVACAFPDCLFIVTSQKGYQNKTSKHYYKISNNSTSTVRKNENMYIAGIFSTATNSVGFINLPTAYTVDEVIECYSEYLDSAYYTLDGRNIFKQQTYNGISIKSEFLGTVDELKVSCPEAFHQEKELDTESGDVISLYFHDLKINSRPYLTLK